MTTLDSDLLRTFLAIIDSGSISAGAIRIGRSQSAVSLQVKRLESIVGKSLFERHARGVVLSGAGEKLESTARQAVMLLDTSLAEIKSDDLTGSIRLGIPDGYSRALLGRIVAEFARRHPRVELNLQCASGAGFSQALSDGKLDIALYEVAETKPHLDILRDEKTYWVSSRFHAANERDPLPIALFDRDCWWRDVALDTLRESGRSYRVVFSSENVAGVMAAIESGIAIGLLGESCIGKGFHILSEPEIFTQMPISKLVLDKRERVPNAAMDALVGTIKSAFESGL